MKKSFILIIIVTLFGCKSTEDPPRFTIKNLDSWGASRNIGGISKDGSVEGEIKKQYKVEFDSEGQVIVNTETLKAFKLKQVESIKFLIHPNCKLKNILLATNNLTDFQRLEFWTQYGIFIVGAPAYGWRRIPTFGNNVKDVKIKVDFTGGYYDIQIEEKRLKTSNLDNCINVIFDGLGYPMTAGFKNVYFEFPDETKWASIELLLAKMFNRIDALRGFWIGKSKRKGNVTIHFHDIYKYK